MDQLFGLQHRGTVPMSFLLELSDNGFSESEESDFWSDFDNP